METPPHLPATPFQLAHSIETCDLGTLSHTSPPFPSPSPSPSPSRVTTHYSTLRAQQSRVLNRLSDVAHALPTYRVLLLSPRRPHTRPPSRAPCTVHHLRGVAVLRAPARCTGIENRTMRGTISSHCRPNRRADSRKLQFVTVKHMVAASV